MSRQPLQREELRAWLGLTLVPGVPRLAQCALLRAFGSPQGVVGTKREHLAQVAGPDVAERIARGPDARLVEHTLAWLDAPGRHFITLGTPEYPPLLAEAGLDAPLVLYAEGRAELLNVPTVAIVGSRNATRQGIEDAERFGRELSEAGFAIVSGLALGIDAAAHRGGLAGASSSLAMMGTGPDILYPRRNAALARELAARGCLVSEFPLHTAPMPGNFPRRNRLISGIAQGVLVVEAAVESGSLITAEYAGRQGREVLAMPGSIHSPLSKGCHSLIRDGAALVESVDDVLRALKVAPAPPRPEIRMENHDVVLQALGYSPATLDELAMRTQLGAATLAARLTRLELEGSVDSLPGGRFQRAGRH